MPGDHWQQFANLRALFGYLYGHPGKKMLFMGGEFGQWWEWNHDESLQWHLLQHEPHRGLQRCALTWSTRSRIVRTALLSGLFGRFAMSNKIGSRVSSNDERSRRCGDGFSPQDHVLIDELLRALTCISNFCRSAGRVQTNVTKRS